MGRSERNNVVAMEAAEPRELVQRADPVLELAALRERIAKAATLEPQPHDLHCRDCFHRGRNAALRLIIGE